MIKNMRNDKSIISGTLVEAKDSDCCVILCHGIRADKNEHGNFKKMSDKLLEQGISSYRFDFTGHGDSTKNFSEFRISVGIEDLECSIKYISNLGYKNIVILGASFGASISALVDYSLYKNVCGLVFWYPALIYSDVEMFSKDNIEKAIKDGFIETRSIKTGAIYNFSKELMVETLNYSPYDVIENLKLPKLFIHGNNDEVVPFGRTEKLAEESEFSDIYIIENGTHGFFDNEKHLDKAIDITLKYILKIIGDNSDGNNKKR